MKLMAFSDLRSGLASSTAAWSLFGDGGLDSFFFYALRLGAMF
jgi:hypothetical protein